MKYFELRTAACTPLRTMRDNPTTWLFPPKIWPVFATGPIILWNWVNRQHEIN